MHYYSWLAFAKEAPSLISRGHERIRAASSMLHLASGLRQQARATARRCSKSSSLPLSLQRRAKTSVGPTAESKGEDARSTLAAGIDINVNQENVHVPIGSEALDSTLLHFLRRRGDTDVKAVCAEGGCGACTVILSEWNNADQAVVHKSVCACLTPLASMDQKQARTRPPGGRMRCCFEFGVAKAVTG